MSGVRQIQRNWAMFLDLDGTLLDIADRPDLVTIPTTLPVQLSALNEALGGAVAIVTGRAMAILDEFIPSPRLSAGTEHGAVVRFPDGRLDALPQLQIPTAWLAEFERAAERWPGVIIERKARSLVAHYRLAPERAGSVEAMVRALPGLAEAGFVVMAARMAFEVKPANASKDRAVGLLMTVAPFAGRVPVFVGDDVTDEAGIAMAERLGGFGLRVPDTFGGDPGRVRDWIARGVAMAA